MIENVALDRPAMSVSYAIRLISLPAVFLRLVYMIRVLKGFTVNLGSREEEITVWESLD